LGEFGLQNGLLWPPALYGARANIEEGRAFSARIFAQRIVGSIHDHAAAPVAISNYDFLNVGGASRFDNRG
jgi:hypothetical protein